MQEFFGIDVGGTAVKWAVLGEDFSIRERGSLPTGFTTAEETVSALIGLVEPYRERVSAVGVSTRETSRGRSIAAVRSRLWTAARWESS